MEAGFEQSADMRQWVSPSLIEANYILSLSQQELQAVIEQELRSNPALEIEDTGTCPACGSALEGRWCATCRSEPNRREDGATTYDDLGPQVQGVQAEADDDFDPLSIVASRTNPRDQILSDVRTVLEPADHHIAEFVVASLDERGFLIEEIGAIADALDVPEDVVELVLQVVQSVAPVGVGARTLAECLRLQAEYLADSGEPVPSAVIPLLTGHLEDLGAHKFGKLAREMGVTVEEIEDARDFVREHLNPHPLQNPMARSWGSPTEQPLVSPDVIVAIRNEELTVEIVDSRYHYLRMNGIYSDLLTRISRKPKTDPRVGEALPEDDALAATAGMDQGDKDHVRQMSNRARLFISNVEQRRETLLKISRVVCEFQEEFLRGGVRNLKPLTRALIAQQVGVHESTVSRATANKYVMLPSRKVIPYSDFFRPSLSTKDIIKEIVVGQEARGHSITDREICDLLLDQGVRIARRTVAKYRSELGILPSTMR